MVLEQLHPPPGKRLRAKSLGRPFYERVLLLLAAWTLTESPMRTDAAFVYVPSSAAIVAALPRASSAVMSFKP